MNIPLDARRDPMEAATAHAQLGKTASSFLAGKHQLFIDGESIDAKSGKKFDVFDPATGQAIAAVAEADKADVDDAVKAARRAFETGPWSKTLPQDRSKLIWKLADLLESHADEIAQLEALDNGKPIRDARNVDLPGSYEILRYMARWATKITTPTISAIRRYRSTATSNRGGGARWAMRLSSSTPKSKPSRQRFKPP